MEWTRYLIAFLPAVAVIVLGWLIRFRRMYFLMSGYNTMSREKKKNVDVERLGVMMGNTLFVMGGILLVGMLLLQLKLTVPGMAVLALLLPVIIYLIVGSQKYDGNTRTPAGTARPGAKILIGFIVVSITGIVILVAVLLFGALQPARITLADGALKTTGLYGQAIPVADMTRAELVETLPKVLRRTNGSALGDQLAGHFTMEGIGAVMLYLDNGKPPFIYIETASQKIYLNTPEPEATRQLFGQIKASRG